MKRNLTFAQPVIKLVRKSMMYYRTISIILMLLTLIYCVYSIGQIFDAPSDSAYRDQELQKNTKTSFDKTTIEQVRQLRTVDDGTTALPRGRLNPFVE